jgi:hypothetical protein
MSNILCPPKQQDAGVPDIILSLLGKHQFWPSPSMFVHLTSLTRVYKYLVTCHIHTISATEIVKRLTLLAVTTKSMGEKKSGFKIF